jgi:hypothetical protein
VTDQSCGSVIRLDDQPLHRDRSACGDRSMQGWTRCFADARPSEPGEERHSKWESWNDVMRLFIEHRFVSNVSIEKEDAR